MRLSALRRWFWRLVVVAAAVAAALAALALSRWSAGQDLRLISIDTGSRTGVYYFAGGAICGLVNDHRWDQGIRCVTDQSAGSISNLRNLRTGDATFGIVQSDWQDNAFHGTGVFTGTGPDTDLRSVFAIYPEPFTVIASAGSGITRFSDLVGKRVNVGLPGSGSRATMEVVMAAMGWQEKDFQQLSELDGEKLTQAICDGEVDAAVAIIAHPNLAVEEMITGCDASLVPVEGPGIDRLVAAHPYYLSYAIPGGTYPRQPATVPVFALAATLVTTSETPSNVVYDVVKDIFAALGEFRALHPAFGEFKVTQMLSEGLTAPMHAGALKYFREVGLLPADGTGVPP
ncbi:MAG: TAXI family TRAP transporter solute-binding subunit [Rhodobacteraceae bacterium]|nr:TAXI family TRAP transporter solute-binding subunit [Paracoccaceae bacterium]